MKTAFTTSLFLCFGTSASALCEDAWYLRNLAFDRAGYCFGSTLGQSVFDADCSTKSPVLDDWDQAMVNAHKGIEARNDCAVNTGSRTLNSSLIGKLEDIDLLPTLSEFESACIGYTGAPVTMTSGIGQQMSYPVGTITPGDTVFFRFEGWGDYVFVETDTAVGWIPLEAVTDQNCEVFAG